MTNNFPRRVGEVSAAWLSDVLSERIEEFAVVDIGAGKGMMGDIFQIRYSTADASSRTIVAKFAAEREDLRATAKRGGIFEREINFYRQIAPVLRCRIPRCYGTWYDDETAEFLILMEHIDADRSVSQTAGVTRAQAELVIKELAALHVPESNVAEYRNLFSLVSAPERRTNQTIFVQNGWESVRQLMPTHLRVDKSPAEMATLLVTAFDYLSALPFYLLHGDARPDNLLFSRSADAVALVDWQGVSLGPREWDIGYFLAQGLRTDDRRAWMADLLDLYVAESSRHGAPPNRDEMVRNIGKAAWFSFGVSCSLYTIADTSRQETIDLSTSMAERSLNLLVDLSELP